MVQNLSTGNGTNLGGLQDIQSRLFIKSGFTRVDLTFADHLTIITSWYAALAITKHYITAGYENVIISSTLNVPPGIYNDENSMENSLDLFSTITVVMGLQ